VISRCLLSENAAQIGGAIACYLNCYPEITDCIIRNNTAENDGGALFFWDSCFPELTNCIIVDNEVTVGYPGYGEGGAVYIESCPSVTFINCTISNNTATSSRGGIYSAASTVTMTNSIVWGNIGSSAPLSSGLTVTYSDIEGGYTGTGNLNVDPLFVNAAGGDYHLQEISDCVDAGLNSAVPVGITTDIDGDDRIVDGDGTSGARVDMGADETRLAIMTVWVDDDYTPGGGNDGHTWGMDAFALIQDGIDAVYFTGTVNVAEGMYIENLIMAKNIKILGAGAYQTIVDGNNSETVVYANGVSTAGKIDGFTLTHGSGHGLLQLGAGLYIVDSDLIISNCVIADNTAASYGGGMEIELNSSPTIINCLFVNNTANYGGAIDTYNNCSPTLYNCTLCYNTSTSGDGGALRNENNCSPKVRNSILWANSGGEIYNLDVCTTTVNNSDVQGGWTGSNNLNVDPIFLNPADGNYRLDPDSLCIDTGLNYAIFISYNEDLDGNPRLAAKLCNINSIVDMGCYEFSRLRIGDFNDDCSINISDLLILSGDWMSDASLTDVAPPYRDGIIDLSDFAIFSNYWRLNF
jgi:parallel beta-helix repeat protein